MQFVVMAQAQMVAELRRVQERLQGEVAAQGLALAGLAAERDACRAAAAASEERLKASPAMLHAMWAGDWECMPRRARPEQLVQGVKQSAVEPPMGQEGYSSHRQCCVFASGYLLASRRCRRRRCCCRSADFYILIQVTRRSSTGSFCKQAVAGEAMALEERLLQARSADLSDIERFHVLHHRQKASWSLASRRWRGRRWRWRSGCCRRAARS